MKRNIFPSLIVRLKVVSNAKLHRIKKRNKKINKNYYFQNSLQNYKKIV